jgi:hypothetical protein
MPKKTSPKSWHALTAVVLIPAPYWLLNQRVSVKSRAKLPYKPKEEFPSHSPAGAQTLGDVS